MKAATAEQCKTADQTTSIYGTYISENQHLNTRMKTGNSVFTVGAKPLKTSFQQLSCVLPLAALNFLSA